MLSIITAAYNAATTLPHSLASVQGQSAAIEHVLIDGGSADGTLALIESHCNARLTPDASRLTRFISEPDRGIYDAMNKGIRFATGEVVGILNADDFYAGPDVLAKVAKVFEDPRVEACYGDLVYVREPGARDQGPGAGESQSGSAIQDQNSTGIEIQNSKFKIQNFQTLRYWKSGPFHPDKFRWGWMPPHPTFFVRRRVYEKYGMFNLELGSAADYELMLRLLFRHRIKVAYIPEVLVCMRAGGVSNASVANRLQANKMDRRAWAVNGLSPYPWTLWCKPLRKVGQWWMKPPKG